MKLYHCTDLSFVAKDTCLYTDCTRDPFAHLKWTKSETIGPNNKLHRNGCSPARFYDNGADVIKRGDENTVITVRLLRRAV